MDGGWLGDIDIDVANEEPKQFPLIGLAEVTMRMPTLLEQAKELLQQQRSPETEAAVRSLIKELHEVDEKLKAWDRNLSDDWRPRTVAYVQALPEDIANAEAWIGPIHMYQDIHVTNILNRQRTVHCMCVRQIIRAYRWLLPETWQTEDRCQHALYREQHCIDDICYSIPFHLGWTLEQGQISEVGRYGKSSYHCLSFLMLISEQ